MWDTVFYARYSYGIFQAYRYKPDTGVAGRPRAGGQKRDETTICSETSIIADTIPADTAMAEGAGQHAADVLRGAATHRTAARMGGCGQRRQRYSQQH